MTESESSYSVFPINGYSLCYEKFGFGPKPILMIPGAIGTAKSDYWPQLWGEDAIDQNMFTMIVVEAPGWGRSTPPARKYGSNVYNNDAECFYELMKHLSFDHFSVIGWSDGAKTALNMSIRYADSIKGLIVIGANISGTLNVIKFLLSTLDIKSWGQSKIDLYLRSYESEERIQELWTKYLRFIEYHNLYFGDDMFKDKYHLIKCPVLIIFGEKDQITDAKQSDCLRKSITRSQLLTIPSAGHDFHQRFPTKFKLLVEKLFGKC